MLEYQLIDFRAPELRGEEQRGDLDDLQEEFNTLAREGWRMAKVIGQQGDERWLVIFERTAPDREPEYAYST